MVIVVIGLIGVVPGDVHGAVHVARDVHVLAQVFGGLVFELLRQAQLVPVFMVPADGLGAVGREHAAIRALGPPQVHAVHLKFVLFGLAAEYGVVVQDQYRRLRPVFMVTVRRGQPGKAAADHYQVIHLAGIHGVLEGFFKGTIADTVTVVHHLMGIAVGCAVIADTTGPGPVRADPGQGNVQRLRTGAAHQAGRIGVQQSGAGSQQGAADKIPAGNVGVEAEQLVFTGVARFCHYDHLGSRKVVGCAGSLTSGSSIFQHEMSLKTGVFLPAE